jgi:hypothetical protein
MIKSRKMTWAGHVVCREKSIRSFVGKPKGKRPLGRIILKQISKIGCEGVDWVWTGFMLPLAGSCDHGNEPLGSIKCWKFLECLS